MRQFASCTEAHRRHALTRNTNNALFYSHFFDMLGGKNPSFEMNIDTCMSHKPFLIKKKTNILCGGGGRLVLLLIAVFHLREKLHMSSHKKKESLG